MARPGLTLSYVAAVAIPARRLVKQGAADNQATLATDGSVPIIGVSEQIPTPINGTVDVIQTEVGMVEAGAAIPRSSPITADASGRAIVANPAAGVNMWSAGHTLETATAAGDLIRYAVVPNRIQG
jgi:Uncharacterized conserved protein (DUF2190)